MASLLYDALMKEITVGFKPRHYQSELMKAFFIEKKKRLLMVSHRRSGKDITAWAITWIAASEKPGLYLYLLPIISQAATVIWRGRGANGTSFLDQIPKSLVKKVNESTMSVHLWNGSIIRVSGSNNFEALIGSNPLGIVFSEFQNSDVRAWELLRPILSENGGWSVFTSTPRGLNHLYDLYETNKDNAEWFIQHLTVKDTFRDDGTPVITDEQIDLERKAGMHESIIQQEFFCSFNSAVRGNYYSDEMKLATDSGRICELSIDRDWPTYTSWDLGISDATSICIFQQNPRNGNVHVIYHFEESGRELAYFAFQLEAIKERLKFKRYHMHYLPHDIRVRELSSGMTRMEQLSKCGVSPRRIVGNHLVIERIQCVRATLGRVWFHKENTKLLVRALSEYKSKWDDKNGISSGPVHDKYSHAADSFGYYCIGAIEHRDPDQLRVQKTYASFIP